MGRKSGLARPPATPKIDRPACVFAWPFERMIRDLPGRGVGRGEPIRKYGPARLVMRPAHR